MKNLLTYVLILGGVLATLSGCQKEEATPSQEEFNPISRLESETLLKQWNTQRKSTLKSAATITITEKQWQKAKIYMNSTDQFSIIALPLVSRLKLCFCKTDQKSEIYFAETRPDSLYLAQNGGKVSLNNYTGLLIFYNDKGKGLIAHQYENGEYKCDYEVESKRSLLKTCDEMNWTETVICTYTRPSGAGGADLSSGLNKNRIRDEKVCIKNDDSGSSPYVPDPVPVPVPIIYEDSLAKNPCAKLAWNLLKTNYSFNSIIQKFLGRNSLVDIKFDVISIGNNTQAKISSLINNTYTISIDNYFASHASTLEVARVMIHEIIHAELNYFYNNCGNNQTTFQRTYPELYARWQAYGYNNKELYQHEEINNQYRNEMKSILMNICPGYTNNVYDAVIWGGLTGTQEWANLSTSQQSAVSAIVTEQRKAGTGNCSN